MDCHAGRPDGERDRRNQSVASFLSSFFLFSLIPLLLLIRVRNFL